MPWPVAASFTRPEMEGIGVGVGIWVGMRVEVLRGVCVAVRVAVGAGAVAVNGVTVGARVDVGVAWQAIKVNPQNIVANRIKTFFFIDSPPTF